MLPFHSRRGALRPLSRAGSPGRAFHLLAWALPCGLLFLPTPAPAQTVALKPSEAGLRVEIDGQLFTEYVVKDTPRPFLYPIIGAAGENVVRNFPMKKGVPGEERFLNERHHRSLWFAHGRVNGIDFWGEYQVFGRQEHAGFSELKAAGAKGSFRADTRWVSPAGQTVLTDERRITITALPGPGGEKLLDFEITLKATEGDVVLGDTKEGTMALRLCPSLSLNSSKAGVPTGPSTGHAFNSKGDLDRNVWGQRAKWVCYYGPGPGGNPVAVVMFSAPDNLRSPTTWHARDYGLFAANPFGLHDFEPGRPAGAGDYTIRHGDRLTLRYRFYFARGRPTPAALDARFEDYARGK